MKRFEQDYELSNKSIDEISATITRVLSRKGLRRTDLVLYRMPALLLNGSIRTGCFQMEIVLQADKLGELDREVLMS